MDSYLKQARQILPPRLSRPRNTRGLKLAQRKALRLYMSALPVELLMLIFDCFTHEHDDSPRRVLQGHVLAHCSLVCRKWSRIAQVRLYRNVYINSRPRLYTFHTVLTNDDELGVHVRRLAFNLNRRPGYLMPLPVGLLSEGEMIANCLARTPHLEGVGLSLEDNLSLPTGVIGVLRMFRRLKFFRLNQHNYTGHPMNNCVFDPRLLRFLGPVQEFHLVDPFLDLARALPDVFRLIYPSPARRGANPGLMVLSIYSEVRLVDAINLPALISTTSIPATLTTLNLALDPFQVPNPELPLWNPFLAACTKLERLSVGHILWRSNWFKTLPVLKELRSLNLVTWNPIDEEDDFDPDDWDLFSQQIIKYVSQTPYLTNFRLVAPLTGYSDASFDRFVRGLLAGFCTGGHCRLRSLRISPTQTDYRALPHQTLEQIVETYSFPQPSIETFELLCRKAQLLDSLHIAVPLDFLSRVTDAVQTLRGLVNAKLHNYLFRIDTSIPLRESIMYQDFLKFCEILKTRFEEAQLGNI